MPTITEESSWACEPGDELVPGLRACVLLGDGRRCETWLAWCARRWVHVAVKLPRPEQNDTRARRALAREAAAVGRLAHPGIQRLLEARLNDVVPHLVFEYIEGPTLATLLDDRGALDRADVVRLGLQLCSALHYVHGHGIAHLDVKPQNLAVRGGRAVLMDFDIARRIGRPDRRARLRGSAPYMAPEQIGRAPASVRMDLFALGATLYEAATDRLAFDAGGDDPDRRYPQLAGPPRPLQSLRPALGASLGSAITTLLAHEPDGRPRSALEAMSLLAAALAPRERGLWPAWIDPAEQQPSFRRSGAGRSTGTISTRAPGAASLRGPVSS